MRWQTPTIRTLRDQVPLWGTDGEAEFSPRSPLDRFFMKVEVGDCWLWTGATDRGYGKFWPNGKTVRAHRWLYEQLVGPVPHGMDLDHLCRMRACVNPDHLEVVTRRMNLARSPLTSNGRASGCREGGAGGHGEGSSAPSSGSPVENAEHDNRAASDQSGRATPQQQNAPGSHWTVTSARGVPTGRLTR